MYFHSITTYEDWQANVAALESGIGVVSDRVKKALEIVKTYHDQPRTVTQGNYNRHPLRVARIVVEELHITDEMTVLIALCHDLGEWTTYDITDLKKEFGEEVYEGVKTLTWDQTGEWADFVDRIVQSNIKNLVAIKIADKLDNNRSIALSGSEDEKKKAKGKTLQTIMPLVEKYYPSMIETYKESLDRLV